MDSLNFSGRQSVKLRVWFALAGLGLFLSPVGTSLAFTQPASPGKNSISALENSGTSAARAREILHQIVGQERNWIQIHAADALIAIGEGASIRPLFESVQAQADVSDYRIGAWRVRANTAESPEERIRWVRKIEAAFCDTGSPDRLDAIESLAKLGWVISGDTLGIARATVETLSEGDSIFALWALVLAGEPEALGRIAVSLKSKDSLARQRAAYALRWLRPESPALLRTLALAAEGELSDSAAYPYLLSAAFALNADFSKMKIWRTKLEELQLNGSTPARYEACQALMARSDTRDVLRLLPLLGHPDKDVQIAAAWTVLSIDSRLRKTTQDPSTAG